MQVVAVAREDRVVLDADAHVEVARRAAAEGTADLNEALELPGADLSGEEFSVTVLPRQADEFTCSRCFLVHHRSQLAVERNGELICRECA
mgnify:CR=1 FL=1